MKENKSEKLEAHIGNNRGSKSANGTLTNKVVVAKG
jgi:hypothetical protein